MSDRETVGWKVDAQVVAEFREFVQDTHGKTRGKLGEELENAMREYMHNDRDARIEDKVDELLALRREEEGATHTQSSGDSSSKSDSAEALDELAEELRESHDNQEAIQDSDVERVIIKRRGHHDETLSRWKGLLKQMGKLYKHPKASIWYFDQRIFFENLANLPEDSEAINQYPADVRDAYDEFLEERDAEEIAEEVEEVSDGDGVQTEHLKALIRKVTGVEAENQVQNYIERIRENDLLFETEDGDWFASEEAALSSGSLDNETEGGENPDREEPKPDNSPTHTTEATATDGGRGD